MVRTAQPTSARPTRSCRHSRAIDVRGQREPNVRSSAHTPAVTRDGVADHAVDQCRVPDRPGRAQGSRCRGLRPVPHRARVHDPRRYPDVDAQAAHLPRSAGHGRRPAGDLPHARRRQRQASALSADADRRTIRRMGWRAIRMVLDRPALLRRPVARAARRPRRAARSGHVPDGRRGGRAPRRARGWSTWRWPGPAPRPRAALRLDVGAMVEVPSLVWQLERCCR